MVWWTRKVQPSDFNITSYLNRRLSMPRRWFVVALLTGLLVLLSVPFGTHLPFIHKVEAKTTNFTLYANYFGWNSSEASGPNPTITVTQGDTISFHFIEDPADAYYYPHLFLLDIDNTTTTDRKSTRLNSSHLVISYAVFCLKKKKNNPQ